MYCIAIRKYVRVRLLALICTLASVMFAQTSARDSPPVSQPNATSTPGRVLGILPNYRAGEESDPFTPLSVRRKFYIGYKDSTDYPVFFSLRV